MISTRFIRQFILWTTIFSCNSAFESPETPHITPNTADVTVLPTASFTFKCESTQPVTWKTFDDFEGTHDIRSTHTPGIQRPHGSILELADITYEYVGYYYCVLNDYLVALNDTTGTELVDAGKASRIYLFVDDPLNPLVEIHNNFIFGAQYSDVLIPCKPTAMHVQVRLLKEGDESHVFNYSYDPMEGYKVKILELTDGGQFECRSDDGEHYHDIILKVNSSPKHFPKPKVTSGTGLYATQGQDLELTCTEEVANGVKFDFTWILPNDGIAVKEGRFIEDTPFRDDQKSQGTTETYVRRARIKNVDRVKDSGVYKCEVGDINSRNNDKMAITILGENESVIEIAEPTNRYVVEISSRNRDVKFSAKVTGHPTPESKWFDNRGVEIPYSPVSDKKSKHEIQHLDYSTILIIRNPDLGDFGNYTVKATNGVIEKEKQFKLIVKVPPSVILKDVYIMEGEQANLTCECVGYPASTIKWSFVPCLGDEECDSSRTTVFSHEDDDEVVDDAELENEAVKTTSTGRTQISNLNFKPTAAGKVSCQAKNSEGTATAEAELVVGDLAKPLQIWGIGDDPVAEGDSVTLECGASIYKHTNDMVWYYKGSPVESSADVQVINTDTKLSYRKQLHWNSIKKEQSGHYECRIFSSKDNSIKYEWMDVEVKDPVLPELDTTNLNDTTKVSLGEPIRLQCVFTGIPRPTIHWYKDNERLELDEGDGRLVFHENKTLLDIKYVKSEDEGDFRCEASSRLGTANRATKLKIMNMPTVSKGLIIGVVALFLVLVLCTICLCMRVRRERRLRKELVAAGLANFDDGYPGRINPELALDEQADLLPYDKKYEFPREKLKLGKQLGAGAYGVVVKAYATGILPYEDETTVAVKMVKQTADNEVMRALVSELKIMVHLGQHLNVVNLLGAVTKNIAKREVMVIVEYCRFGNLQNFLIKHRDYFIDQIVRDQDIIDPTIVTKEQRWSNDSGYDYYNSVKADARKSGGGVSVVNSGYTRHSDYFPGGMDSANTEATLISRNTNGGEDNMVMSNNSVQPAWRSNYKMDYKGPARTVTTTDLLCWSFQVARGMEYLASRKVLHGDLAARNILLCDDNVVKICDFGLARSMYKNDNYKKKGEAMLPFKWLAIESIGDRVFSTYSDVWSFGIVLWELFSLGKVPYPGMSADEELYFKLKDGYRMEKPEFATQDIYDVMLQCWSAHPESRPLFDNLSKSLGKLLENGVAEHYIDLNEPYLQMNTTNFAEGQTDYLALMAPPDCPAPPVPQYVNTSIQQVAPAVSLPNYMTMSPTINSPLNGADTHDSHFRFPSLNSPMTSNIPGIPEEIPMLKRSDLSINTDSETEATSPDAKSSSNNLNSVRFNNDLRSKNTNVLHTANDNYVNVPSTIINMNATKDAVSNPSYVVVGNINETRT